MKAIGYKDEEIQAAAQMLANVLADLGGEGVPSPGTPDMSVVRSTNGEHPAAQCRLDTYLAGLACPVTGDMSDTDPKVNSCYVYLSATSYEHGSRSRCWFAPVSE